MMSVQSTSLVKISELTPKIPTLWWGNKRMAKNCDQRASCGLVANLVKSGSLTISVEKFAMDDMIPLTNAQARALP